MVSYANAQESKPKDMIRIHCDAEVSENATIGRGTFIWNHSQVRSGAVVGENCFIGKNVYIDENIVIGDNVKIYDRSSIYRRVIIESYVDIESQVCFSRNRRIGRLILASACTEPAVPATLVGYGSKIGANSTILPGVSIGRYSIIKPGSLVNNDIPDFSLVEGKPGRVIGHVCQCSRDLKYEEVLQVWYCNNCRKKYNFPIR